MAAAHVTTLFWFEHDRVGYVALWQHLDYHREMTTVVADSQKRRTMRCGVVRDWRENEGAESPYPEGPVDRPLGFLAEGE